MKTEQMCTFLTSHELAKFAQDCVESEIEIIKKLIASKKTGIGADPIYIQGRWDLIDELLNEIK